MSEEYTAQPAVAEAVNDPLVDGEADRGRLAAHSGWATTRIEEVCDIRGLRQFWSVQSAIFLGFWLWFLVDGRSRYLRDPGVFWHTVVGRQILTTGQFPHVDQFNFTCAGKPWIASQWLGECGLALLHWMSEFDGLLLGTATLLACFYTWVAHRLIRSGTPWWFAVLLVALAVKASSYHFFARPHLASLVFLGWTFARLCDFEAGRIPLRGLFMLVPVSAVWANTHGGVLGGIGTLALAVGGWGLAKVIGLPTPLARYQQLIPLCCLVLCCGLATLANPYGLELPRLWLALMGSPIVHQHILEHQPIIQSPYAWTVVLFGLVYLTMLVSVSPRRIRVTWLLPLVWFYLAWTRIRHGPLFATVAVLALADMIPSFRWSARLSQWGSNLLHLPDCAGRQRPGWRSVVIPVVVVAAAIFLQTAGVALPVLGRGWARLDPKVWPVDLLPELREYERTHSVGTPIFNQMKFGGFLIYYTPGLRVFIDDRCELYGDERLLAYVHAHDESLDQLDRWAQQYGFDRALVATGSPFDHILRRDSTWRVVRETKAATLHERIVARKFPELQDPAIAP